MPNRKYLCDACHEELDLWQPITDPPSRVHEGSCGGELLTIIERVNTHGVGPHGAKTREVDAREGRWDKDLPAYKRFRDKGLQPPHIDGADHLEATAQSTLEVETMGKVKVSDSRAQESRALAQDIVAGRA